MSSAVTTRSVSPVCGDCGRPTTTQSRARRCQCADRESRRAATAARAAAEVAIVVDLVHRVDPTVPISTVARALNLIAPSGQRRRPLVSFLRAHPEALTSGSSRAPKSLGHLIIELAGQGVTGLVAPRCADCGQPNELFHTKGADRICRRCYEQQSATERCGCCGKRCRPRGRAPDGAAICQNCQHKSRALACSRCRRVRPVNYSRADGKPYCRGCRARNHLEPCADCGELRPVNIRHADGRGLCGSCYARTKTPETCATCYQLPARACGICGRTRRVALRATATTPDTCPTCYPAPEIICSICGTTALGRRTTADGQPMCFRCQATRLVDQALTGPDDTIRPELRPVRDAIVAADNPRSTLSNFASDKSTTLLRAIAQNELPLSHEALDEHAGRHSVEHLRGLLVAAGALPARDEYLQRLQRFTADLLGTVENPAHRRLLAAFTRWHLLARLRASHQSGLTPSSAHRCRADLTAAHRFLGHLRDRGHGLDAAPKTTSTPGSANTPSTSRTPAAASSAGHVATATSPASRSRNGSRASPSTSAPKTSAGTSPAACCTTQPPPASRPASLPASCSSTRNGQPGSSPSPAAISTSATTRPCSCGSAAPA